MTSAAITAFLFLTIPAFFTPGPNNLMLMTSSAKFGPRRTLAHFMGINIGFPTMVLIVGFGLGEVFTAFPIIKTVMKYLAVAYFLWMAWNLLGLKLGAVVGRERPMKFIEAALFQWVNPKAWAMATSFVSTFVVSGDGRFASVLLLALGCFSIGPFSSSAWVFFGQQLHAFLVRTGTERFLGAVLAALMIVAVVLFLL